MRRGYRSYHGRRSTGKILLAAALVLVLLGAAAYITIQNFVVYESDGSIRLDLPFFHRDEAGGEAEDGDLPPVEILPGDGEAQAEPLRAGVLSAAQLCGAGALEALEAGDCDGLVVEMKGDNGFFYYTSELAKPRATADSAVSQARMSAVLAEAEELQAIARISCFHDSFYAFSDMAGAGICQSSGYIWYDNQSSYWLEPSKQAARDYLYAVAGECVAMGFDQILLSGFTYPTEGNLSQIDYSHMTVSKEDALCGFLTGLREAVGEEIPLSVELSEAVVLAGRDETAGLDLARILPLVDRVYVAAADEQAVLDAVTAAGGTENQVVFIREDLCVSAVS